jgi:hypothetical protein
MEQDKRGAGGSGLGALLKWPLDATWYAACMLDYLNVYVAKDGSWSPVEQKLVLKKRKIISRIEEMEVGPTLKALLTTLLLP